MSDEIEKRVKEIISEHLGVKQGDIKPEATFVEDLGADSLDTVELVMTFEDEFQIEIPDDVAMKILTVGDALKHIRKTSEAQTG